MNINYGVLSWIHTANKTTLSLIQKWITRFDGANGCLQFFSDGYDKTLYYKHLALPLLSMKITASISVERVAKPLKNGVLN